jgi:hypothetical protein
MNPILKPRDRRRTLKFLNSYSGGSLAPIDSRYQYCYTRRVPSTQVFFYGEADGGSSVVEWLRRLRRDDPDGFMNCLARLELLEAAGHELRRPAADLLRGGIYELRAKHKHVQYRLLYFFSWPEYCRHCSRHH